MRDLTKVYQNNTITVKYIEHYGNPFNYPSTTKSVTNYTGETLQRWRGRSDVSRSDGQRPTYYRAYSMDVDAVTKTMSQQDPYWTWGWRFTPHVPINGRMWYYNQQTFTGQGYISDVYTRKGIDPDGFPIVPTSLKNEVRTKALLKLIDSEVNLGITVGESRETAAFVFEQAGRAIKALRQIKARQFRKAAATLRIKFDKKTMADNWLAYQFGLSPLLNDIYNGVDAIRKAQVKQPFIKVQSVATANLQFPIVGSYSYTGTVTQGVQAAYTYKLQDKGLASLTTLGLTNPLSVAWELLPGSYLIDWFASVGDVLTALNADLGYDYAFGYETEFVRGDFAISSTSYPGPEAWEWKVKSKAMERTFAPAPKPALYIKHGLNIGQGITSLALKTKGLR